MKLSHVVLSQFWKCDFAERENCQVMWSRRHGSPVNREPAMGVTSFPGHSVSSQSLLTIVQDGTSSALKERTVPSLVTKEEPGSATQRLFLYLTGNDHWTQNVLKDEKRKHRLKILGFSIPLDSIGAKRFAKGFIVN